MKIIKNIFLVMVLALMSCENLDETPYDFTSSNNLYQNEADVDAALLGVYQSMILDGVDDLWNFLALSGASGAIRANFPYRGGAQSRFAAITPIPTDPQNGFWVAYYRGINRANTAMKLIPGVGLDTNVEAQKIAEARFMRAFFYFNLTHLFGDVPLHLESTENFDENSIKLPRSPQIDIYNQIIEDLQFAESNLPESYSADNNGRATSAAAKALLGKVYLHMAGKPLQMNSMYDEAANKLQEVIGRYSLEPNFLDVFSLENEDANSEVIFARKASSNFSGTGTVLTYFAAAPNSPYALWIGGGQFQFGFTEDFYNSYNPEDTRRDVTMLYNYVDRDGEQVTYNDPNNPTGYLGIPVPRAPETGVPYGKLRDGSSTDPFFHGNDLIYMRYADVLLMLAESLNESGRSAEGLPYLNEVRNRAGLGDITTTDPNELREIIKQERKWELAGEFVEYYDLQRWGDVSKAFDIDDEVEFLGAAYDPKYELYPIPQAQLDANEKLTQNPGY